VTPRRVLVPITVLPLAIAVACSSSGGADSADTDAQSPMKTEGIVCAKDVTKTADVPSGFPSDFPFPPGMKVLSADDRGSAGIVVTGVTDRPFKATLASLNRRFPAAGYKLEDGESEPHDAESDWVSDKYEGRWAIREIPGCADDTSVQVVASPKK
jgi:hypothetical protein